MSEARQIRLIGSTVAAIVCHRRLQELAIPVEWYRVESNLGGHFSGQVISGLNLDRGMVLLETSSPLQLGKLLEVSEFSNLAESPNGIHVRSLLPAAYEWLRNQGFEFSEVRVQSEVSGYLDRDFFIADHLDSLSRMTLEDTQTLIYEIHSRRECWQGPLHPRNKLSNPEFNRVSLRNYCQLVYGPKFIEVFLEPILTLFGAEVAEVSARFHRQIWFPLYYPESLLSRLGGEAESNLLGQEFYVPRGCSISTMVKSLWANEASRYSRAHLLSDFKRERSAVARRQTGDLDVWLTSHKEIQKSDPSEKDGMAHSRASQRKNPQATMHMDIEFWEIDESLEDQCIFFTSHPEIYRLTSRRLSTGGGGHRQVLILEMPSNREASEDAVRGTLASYISLAGSRVLGTTKGAIALVRAEPGSSVTGDEQPISSGFNPFGNRVGIPNSLMSFNDQLILGLWTAERIANVV